jgi:hypothetical protein
MNVEEQKQRYENWRKIIDEYLQSGMTQKSFCEKENLSLPKFVYYYSQFKRENELPLNKPSFVPVKVPNLEKSAGISEIKLSLPNGFQCTFPSHIDVSQIKRLIEVFLSC